MYINYLNGINTSDKVRSEFKNATVPIKSKPITEGYEPVTARLWGADGAKSPAVPFAAFIPSFGRKTNNPANMDPMEADTQSGFKLSQLTHEFACPDCGKPIMTKPMFADIKRELDSAGESTYLSVIEDHSEFLLPQEEKILKFLKTQKEKHPERTLTQIVKGERQKRLGALEKKQYKILDEMGQYASSLTTADQAKVSQLLEQSGTIIFERQENFAFNRGKFLELVETLGLSNAEAQTQLSKIAHKLPSSKNDVTAWFVKYGGKDRNGEDRTSREIAEKLVAPAYTNTDHIHPHDLGGYDAVSNFWLMHARCNIIKTNKPFMTWFNEDKAGRTEYMRKYLRESQAAIDADSSKALHPKYDNYAAKVSQTIYELSQGQIDFREEFPMPEDSKGKKKAA